LVFREIKVRKTLVAIVVRKSFISSSLHLGNGHDFGRTSIERIYLVNLPNVRHFFTGNPSSPWRLSWIEDVRVLYESKKGYKRGDCPYHLPPPQFAVVFPSRRSYLITLPSLSK
jgi:hypothetical protein